MRPVSGAMKHWSMALLFVGAFVCAELDFQEAILDPSDIASERGVGDIGGDGG